MKTIKLLVCVCVICLLFSCKTTTITPYYTTVDKMYNLENGMSLDAVNKTLGVDPYEIYMDVNSGNKVLVYKYKKKYQKIPMNKVDKEEYLATPALRYKDEGNIYTIYASKGNTLVSYYTGTGRNQALEDLIWEDKMQLVLENPSELKKKEAVVVVEKSFFGGTGKSKSKKAKIKKRGQYEENLAYNAEIPTDLKYSRSEIRAARIENRVHFRDRNFGGKFIRIAVWFVPGVNYIYFIYFAASGRLIPHKR